MLIVAEVIVRNAINSSWYLAFYGKFWFSVLLEREREDWWFSNGTNFPFLPSSPAGSVRLIIDQSTLSNLNGFDTPKKWQKISNDCYLTIGLALKTKGQLVKLPLFGKSLGTFSHSHSSWKKSYKSNLEKWR